MPSPASAEPPASSNPDLSPTAATTFATTSGAVEAHQLNNQEKYNARDQGTAAIERIQGAATSTTADATPIDATSNSNEARNTQNAQSRPAQPSFAPPCATHLQSQYQVPYYMPPPFSMPPYSMSHLREDPSSSSTSRTSTSSLVQPPRLIFPPQPYPHYQPYGGRQYTSPYAYPQASYSFMPQAYVQPRYTASPSQPQQYAAAYPRTPYVYSIPDPSYYRFISPAQPPVR